MNKHVTIPGGASGRSWNNQTHDQQVYTIIAYEDAGITLAEIAEIMDVGEETLHRALLRAGVESKTSIPTEWVRLYETDKRLDRIKQMDRDGMTPAQIAKELGTTRGAVVTTAFRGKYHLISKDDITRVPIAGGWVSLRGKRTIRKSLPVHPDVSPEYWQPIHGPAVPFLEADGCKWPIEGGCCNGKIARKSYCKQHFQMAYRNPIDVGSAPKDMVRSVRPMASQSAMRMTGVSARRVEREE